MKLVNLGRSLSVLGAVNLAERSHQLETAGPGVFISTATTGLMLRAARDLSPARKKVLDLGCGWGVIGLELALAFDISLSMSDLSRAATNLARLNSVRLGVDAEVREGPGLDPWGDDRFDIIIADVSGISSSCPLFEVWFGGIPAATGETGHDLTVKVLEEARGSLLRGGSVLVPLISLSNREVALTSFHLNFSSVRKANQIDWKIGNLDEDQMDSLHTQRRLGNVDFRQSGNDVVCWTEVYILEQPN